jgi:hypothetical protein
MYCLTLAEVSKAIAGENNRARPGILTMGHIDEDRPGWDLGAFCDEDLLSVLLWVLEDTRTR